MQIGIFAYTFRRPTLEGILDAVKAHSFQQIQFNMGCVGMPELPDSVDDAVCDHVRRKAAAREITMATLSGTFNMSHPDAQHRDKGIKGLQTLVSAAKRLGIPVITLCTGTRDAHSMWRKHPDNNTPEAWRDLTATMGSALQIAEEAGVMLAIEPEVSNVVDSAQKARRLLDEMQSRHLGIIMDGANLFHEGELPQMRRILSEAFELLGGDIVSAHAKDLDHDGEAGHLAAGKGVLDYAHYLTLLCEADFEGPILLHGLQESEVSTCLEFLNETLRKNRE